MWNRFSDRLYRPGVRRYLLLAALDLALALLQYDFYGISAMALGLLGMAFVLVAEAYYASTGPVTDEPEEQPGRQSPGRSWIGLLAALAMVVAMSFADRVTIGGRPVLAGPLLQQTRTASSQTVGPAIASPGMQFVVVDVEVASHLGTSLGFVYYGDFELEVDGDRLDPAPGPSQDISRGCDGFEVEPWSSEWCRVVFEVPSDATSARLYIDETAQKVHSGVINLRNLPQARLPRVELRTRTGWVRPDIYRPSTKRARVFVEARAVDGASPVSLERLTLQGVPGTDPILDRSGRIGLPNACSKETVVDVVTCVAIFDVPQSADEARLSLTTFHRPQPGAPPSAGVATVDLRP